jgi:hypothetical protein
VRKGNNKILKRTVHDHTENDLQCEQILFSSL